MDYLFEQLNDESFQHLCQALLVRDYPDLQSFPVGQPDGGRDASSRGDSLATLTVGQVKFKREDTAETADWMIDALQGELAKVQALAKARQASRYIMMTNARSSAHLNVGKVDRVQKWMDDNMPIPSQVLWRDDLNARLDGANDVRLAYPAILTGEAALSLVVEAQLGPEKKRLAGALRSFLSEQYRKDEEVKFRQVDLADSLLSLFVDVPVDVSGLAFDGRGPRRLSRDGQWAVRNVLNRSRHIPESSFDGFEFDVFGLHVGAADFLLAGEIQRELPWIMLQGAPGQGKSTLAQYVCQVHRARYLSREGFVNQLSPEHVSSGFRLPFKIDLRDVASFFDGQPFLGHAAEPMASDRTFERFLAHLVSIQAGAIEFSVGDLRAVLSDTPALFFLDGLDEVADLALRESLVDKIVSGLHRLREIKADTQVVLTTRPSQIGRAPKFSKEFVRLTLAPIGTGIVRQYGAKWTGAKKLEADRRDEVLGILEEKLELSHIRDLTKNPMQLSILLSLILSIGHSLPDVRTDLYAKYVDLFMTREAEKDVIVRVHQALLLEIVEFLAWRLQNGAESERTTGSISSDDLRELVRKFLVDGHHDVDILDDLFGRGLERVYVLVQRIEGLYEFEVQPLREYFAAKYLYASAPVASFRSEHVQGDRAQRFEAIAANPYWANVTRFYAGFYQGGELGALAASLREMIAMRDISASLNARAIAVLLLSDRTFASKKAIQAEVVNAAFDEIGVYSAASSRPNEIVSLPEDSGRDLLASIVFHKYVLNQSSPSINVSYLLRRNGGAALGKQIYDWVAESTGADRTDRFGVAVLGGAATGISPKSLSELVMLETATESEEYLRLTFVLRDGEASVRMTQDLADRAFDLMLAWGGVHSGDLQTDVGWLGHLLTGSMSSRFALQHAESPPTATMNEARNENFSVLKQQVEQLQQRSYSRDDARRASYWADYVGALEATLGTSWATYRLVICTVGQVGRDQAAPEGVHADSLFSRALAARRRRGNSKFWLEQISQQEGPEKLLWLALALAWAPSRHVEELNVVLDQVVGNLSADDYWRLLDVLLEAARIRESVGGSRRKGVSTLGRSARMQWALAAAFGDDLIDVVSDLGEEHLPVTAKLRRRRQKGAFADFPGWEGMKPRSEARWLKAFAEMRLTGDHYSELLYTELRRSSKIPRRVAERVASNASQYPATLVDVALERLQDDYSPMHVQDVYESEKWVFS